ncbi:MAG: hypothetical protein K6G47_08675 [Clostridia bacterium]|nr:hypothetical protein [Clostridiales bacterium]MCR5804326.1 hypothetical protein [Clostridia bacterium]
MKNVFAKILSIGIMGLSMTGILAGFKVPVKADVVPRLIITGSDIDKDEIKAGDDFELTIHMKNESKKKLTNIKLTLSSEENNIVPKSGTNSIYVDSVDKEAEFDVAVEMTTKSDLLPNTYSVNVKYAYEEDDWRFFEDEAELTVPIVQIPKLSVTGMKLTRDSVIIDGKTSCSLRVNNTGKSDIYNVNVVLKGNNIQTTDDFIGSIPIENSVDVDLSVLSTALGTGDIVAEVTYEDAQGNVYSNESSVTLSVVEPVIEPVIEKEPIYMDRRLWVAGGVVLLVIVVGTIIRKKREKAYA